MSGKENNKDGPTSGVQAPTNVGAQDELDGAEFPASGDEIAISGSITPHSQDGIP